MVTGPRAGQRVCEGSRTRLVGIGPEQAGSGGFGTQLLPQHYVGTEFLLHRSDSSVCGPSRANMQTGMLFQNHFMGNDMNSPGAELDYYRCYRYGYKDPTQGWAGPWEIDLAAQAGLPVTPVAASSQPILSLADQSNATITGGDGTTWLESRAMNRLAQAARGDVDDDLQAFSGNIFTNLARLGITVGFVGKYTNPYGRGDLEVSGRTDTDHRERFVPPGVQYFAVEQEDGQDHWNSVLVEYGTGSQQTSYLGAGAHISAYDPPSATPGATLVPSGDNPYFGEGAIGGKVTYRGHRNHMASISRTNGVATVVCANAHGFNPGDELAVDCAVDASFEGRTWIVSQVDTAKQVRFACPGPDVTHTGLGNTGDCIVWVAKLFQEDLFRRHALNFIATRRDDEPWILFYCSTDPHWQAGTSIPQTTTAEQTSNAQARRYMDTIAIADAFYWNGVAGALSPAGMPSGSGLTTCRWVWKERQEMWASIDDSIAQLVDMCDGRWGKAGSHIFMTDDNGFQLGEQWARDSTAGFLSKESMWDGSLRIRLWVRSPLFPAGAVSSFPTFHHDLPATFLHMVMGDRSHFWHLKRDGVSILALFDPNAAEHGRCVPVRGHYHNSAATGIITCTNDHGSYSAVNDFTAAGRWKYAINNPGGSSFFQRLLKPELDYEVTEYFGGAYAPVIAALEARRAAVIVARYDAASDTNPVRTL